MRSFLKRFFPQVPVIEDDASLVKLNLGCGRDYREGWQNWDISDAVRADARLDFSKDTFPAKDAFFDRLYANGVLEQIEGNRNLVHFMNECQRVLKAGGKAVFILPNARYPIAFRDPHDVRHLTPETFQYFCNGQKRYERYGKLYGYLPWSSYSVTTDRRGLMTVVLVK